MTGVYFAHSPNNTRSVISHDQPSQTKLLGLSGGYPLNGDLHNTRRSNTSQNHFCFRIHFSRSNQHIHHFLFKFLIILNGRNLLTHRIATVCVISALASTISMHTTAWSWTTTFRTPASTVTIPTVIKPRHIHSSLTFKTNH